MHCWEFTASRRGGSNREQGASPSLLSSISSCFPHYYTTAKHWPRAETLPTIRGRCWRKRMAFHGMLVGKRRRETHCYQRNHTQTITHTHTLLNHDTANVVNRQSTTHRITLKTIVKKKTNHQPHLRLPVYCTRTATDTHNAPHTHTHTAGLLVLYSKRLALSFTTPTTERSAEKRLRINSS